ncbi:MAG: hypothetical protein JWM27_764 [Gemmatimonadetes bacterium]|nr:hypothetical protein [Gemmatimonadota bacterium]
MADNLSNDDTLNRAEAMAAGRAVPVTDAGHLLPEHASAGEAGRVTADDPEVARSEIDRTRARMSRTLDSIEAALVRKKAQIQERLDVMGPVRERPLLAMGAVFGVALVLGYATGGGDADDRGEGVDADGPALGAGLALEGDPEARARAWERRARRLQKVARAQEEELAGFRGGGDWDDEEGGLRALAATASGLRDTVLGSVAGFLTEAFHKLAEGAGDVAEAGHDAYDTVRDRAGDVFDDLRDRAEPVLERVADGYHDVRDRVHDGVDLAKEKAGDAKDRAGSLRG